MFSDLTFSRLNVTVPRGQQKSKSFWIMAKRDSSEWGHQHDGVYPTQQFILKFKSLTHSFDYQIFPEVMELDVDKKLEITHGEQISVL